MDDIKLYAKNEKEKNGDFDRNNKNIQPGYRNGIWHIKICHVYNGKYWWGGQRMKKNCKIKKESELLARKKYLGISEADTIKQAEMKGKKIRKEYLRRTRKLLEKKLCSKNLYQKNKHQGNLSSKVLKTILKIDKLQL